MMGQETGQRSTLTANHGTYYLDTAVGKDKQLVCPAGPCLINVFKENETYYLFLIFAKESTEQTYRFFVGENTTFDPASIQMVQANIGTNPVVFDNFKPLPAGRARGSTTTRQTAKGVVEVLLKVSDFPDVADEVQERQAEEVSARDLLHLERRRPKRARTPREERAKSVCRWAVADQDCPDGGCIGIVFTLPAGFTTLADPRLRAPAAACLPKAPPWDVSLKAITVSDGICPKASDTLDADFCK